MELTDNVSPAEDTAVIQKAIEQIADQEASPQKTEEKPVPPPSGQEAGVHRWFFTFMCMNIPVIGWFYLFYLAFSKKHPDRKSFARAYLFYKLIFLILGMVILIILVHIGMELLDQLLAYMEML